MAVTDEQVAALRAYLTAGTEDETQDAERGFLTLSRTAHLDGTGERACSSPEAAGLLGDLYL